MNRIKSTVCFKDCLSSFPCYSYPLETVTRFIAYFWIFSPIFTIICMSVVSVMFLSVDEGTLQKIVKETNSKDVNEVALSQILRLEMAYRVLFFSWKISSNIFIFIFQKILLFGARQHNATKVQLWFMFTIIRLVLMTPIDICLDAYLLPDDMLKTLIPNILDLVLLSWALFVVFYFIKELLNVETHLVIVAAEDVAQLENLVACKTSDRKCCGYAFIWYVLLHLVFFLCGI